jgi:hypothetical protein
MPARVAIDPYEIARPEILDTGRVEENHLRPDVLCLFGTTAWVEPGRQPRNRVPSGIPRYADLNMPSYAKFETWVATMTIGPWLHSRSRRYASPSGLP